jgi:PEP-CTERM/exosortase A-associated glycosyltransferase
MRIGIVYGHISSNYGDIAINYGTAAMLHRLTPTASVHVVLLNLPESQLAAAETAFKGPGNVSFTILRTRDKIRAGISSDYSNLALATQYVLDPPRFIADAGLTGCDIVLHNSGEYVFAYQDRGNHIELIWRVLPALAAKATGMRFVSLPSTFGPFEAPDLAPMLRAFFFLNDAFAARESTSAEIVAKFLDEPSPPALLDPSFFMPATQSPRADDEAILGLVMRPEGFGLRVGTFYDPSEHATSSNGEETSASTSLKFAVAAARCFLDQVGGKVHLIIASHRADHDLTQGIAHALAEQGYGDRVSVIEPDSVAEYQEELARASFIVASRFHACVLGLLSGRPIMGVYFDEHGHKMPGLFSMLEVPAYLGNLSRTSPELLAESIVPLFLNRERAFGGVPERLHAMQDETLEWFKQALKTERAISHEELRAASLAYIRGVEAVRAVAAPDMVPLLYREAIGLKAELNTTRAELNTMGKDVARLRAELAKEKRTAQALRWSLSFQLGSMLLRPVRKPGRVLFPLTYRLLRMSPDCLKRAIQRVLGKSRILTSLQSYAKALTLSATQQRRLRSISSEPDLGEQEVLFESFVEQFKRVVLSRPSNPFVIISTGSKRIGEDNRANRTMMFAQELAAAEIPVIHIYYRFKGGREFAAYRGGYLLEIPNDFFRKQSRSIAAWDFNAERLFICSIPDAPSVEEVGLFKRQGWKVAYEVRDDWEELFKEGGSRWYDAENERLLCRQADFVTTVSVTLRDKMVSMGADPDRTFLVPNGLRRDFLKDAKASFTRRRSGYRGNGTIGYFGSLTERWFNWGLLLRTALRRPDLRFEIIGFGEPEGLNLPRNIAMLGTKNHEQIIEIASNWSIAMIPFKNTKLAEGVDPIKIYEYLALGLPCVSCWMPQVKHHPLTFTYEDDSKFEEVLDMALKYTPSEEDWARTRSFVAGSTWDQRLQATLSLAGIDISIAGGMKLPQIPPRKSPPEINGKERTVLMVLHYSLPYHSNGYAVRSHGLLSSLRKTSWDVIPCTRPGYPWEAKQSSTGKNRESSQVDEIRYLHLRVPGMENMRTDYSNYFSYFQESATAIQSLAKAIRPSVIHAASNHLTALPALIAARRAGIPFVYEVRGLWEITEISADPHVSETSLFRLKQGFESLIAKEADRVITLTSGLRDELVSRGVNEENIKVVPNCVDVEKFKPLPPNERIRRKLGLADAPTIGYVGSFVGYEGLDDLVRAASILKKRGIKFNLLFVGDGKTLDELRALVRRLRLRKEVFLTGRVPFGEVGQYHSLVDIAVFPRKPLPVCEMVSPLKPLEAMAMRKVIVVSSVDALKDIVTHGQTGLVFEKGNIQDLADKLEQVVEDKDLATRLSNNSLQWVREQRPWDRAADQVAATYEDVVSEAKAHSVPESSPPEITVKPDRPSILVAGHDLKFIDRLCEGFSRQGHDVLIDKWKGHNQHDVAASRELLDKADIIVCEWCLGNAVWYSKNKRPGQKLIVRFHEQERYTDFPRSVVVGRVDKVIFVGPHVKREATTRFGWERWADEKFTLIPNYVDVSAFNLPKESDVRFNIGICGFVPSRKRLDRAVDIIEKLRQEDERFRLYAKGKMPRDYPWMRGRAKELEYYDGVMKRINTSDLAKDAVHFDGWGVDMPYEWYRKIGFILSTSDLEAFHLSVVEGAASKAVPILLRWEGADEIYPPDWSYRTAGEAAQAIVDILNSGRYEEIAEARHLFVRQYFDIGRVARMWLEMIEGDRSLAGKTDASSPASAGHET